MWFLRVIYIYIPLSVLLFITVCDFIKGLFSVVLFYIFTFFTVFFTFKINQICVWNIILLLYTYHLSYFLCTKACQMMILKKNVSTIVYVSLWQSFFNLLNTYLFQPHFYLVWVGGRVVIVNLCHWFQLFTSSSLLLLLLVSFILPASSHKLSWPKRSWLWLHFILICKLLHFL
jgi:hypothetical protein